MRAPWLLDVLYEVLEDWYQNTSTILECLTERERDLIRELADRIMKDEPFRSREQVEANCVKGKLAELAVARRFIEWGIPVKYNIEKTTHEYHWDLMIQLEDEWYKIEVKTQTKISDSIRFQQTSSHVPAILTHWERCDAIVVVVPCELRSSEAGEVINLWCVLDPKVVSALQPYREDLTNVKGVQVMIDRLTPEVARIKPSSKGIKG